MKKIFIFIVMVLFLVSFAFAQEEINKNYPQITEQWCDLNNPCPEGLECNSFPNIGLRCAEHSPCSYYECSEGYECRVAASYPGSVTCSCVGPECPTSSGDEDTESSNQGQNEGNNVQTQNQADVTQIKERILTQAQIKKIIKSQNRIKVQAQTGECPINCTCTGSSTKCQLANGVREMTITAGNSGNTIVQVKGVDMSTKVELYQSEGEVYGVFKSNTKIIKVMPDQVQTILTEEIGGLEEHEIELDENGEYQVQARKKARLFGFIPVRKRVRFEMNSETGEVIRQRNSWWGFLARDELIVGNRCATVSPDSRDECCQNKGFDSYNQETGECEIDTLIDEVVK